MDLLPGRLARLCLLVLCCTFTCIPGLAQEPDYALPDYALIDTANADNGKVLADDERCQECHGVDGNIPSNNEAGKIPRLAGQHPAYLLKQFNDFRSGAREHDFMALMARTVDDETAVDIIAHYAAQPIMKGSGAGDNLSGKKLYLEGDNSRQIQACANCHGLDGKGVTKNHPSPIPGLAPELIPVIGGQDWHYLEQQLRDWRSGTRTNSIDGVMNKVTAKLNDGEINALTDYISGL
jgi:cytochrome c553